MVEAKNKVVANDSMEAEVYASSRTILCRAKKSFIPKNDFKNFFYQLESLVEQFRITKLVFDKTALSVFDQESMEWYHIHWKEAMFEKGLKHYRKILPKDSVFEQSVIIGRRNIKENNPDFSFEKFDIQYCSSLDEALAE